MSDFVKHDIFIDEGGGSFIILWDHTKKIKMGS